MVLPLGLSYVGPEDLAACLDELAGHVLGVAAFGHPLPASFQFHFEGETRRRRASDEDSAHARARSERGSQRSVTDEMELESSGVDAPPSTRLSPAWVEMPVLGGDAKFEIWSSSEPVVRCSDGEISGSRNHEILYGHIEIFQAGGESLEAATFRAYIKIFDYIDREGYANLLRIWNYFPQINAIENGIERYRSFNVGRHDAFIAAGRVVGEENAPAASVLGTQSGPLIIYFLSGKQAGQPVENPRQTSPYNYPHLFGPRSPAFSRAMLLKLDQRQYFFISGTASIVGHETVHGGNVTKQTHETLANIRTLLQQASEFGYDPFVPSRLLLKVYLRHPADLPLVRDKVEAEFGAQHQAVYLQADICRADLLLEIEGVYLSGDQQ